MSYVVLARRYRPQRFSDVIGQDHISNTLKSAIQQGRTHHAYLLSGPRGTGKTSSARILAKALRCLSPEKDGEPCNKCEACTQVNDGRSLDVIEIDAASNNGVDNIRDLRENVGFAATVGKIRVYIVDEVHMLSTAAFNALLKTLEEPPSHIVFILATTELHKVPATVQSRCQRFDFRKVPSDVLMANLQELCNKEKVSIDESSLQVLVNESEGCVRDAQSLLDRSIALCGNKIDIETLTSALGLMDREAFATLIRAMANHDTRDSLEQCTQMLDRGVDPKMLLNRVVEFFRDLHFYFFTQKTQNSDPFYKTLLAEISQKLSTDEIVRALDLGLKTQSTLSSSSNSQFTIESLVVKLSLQRPAGSSQASVATPARESATAPAAAPKTPPRSSAPATRENTPVANPATAQPPAASSAPTPINRNNLLGTLEDYIRAKKPAWTPVLQAIVEITLNENTVRVKARGDFAGKRLASNDGQELLKTVFKATRADVELETAAQSTAPRKPSMEDKKQQATQDESVQAALKVFSGAQISETQVLEDDKKPFRR